MAISLTRRIQAALQPEGHCACGCGAAITAKSPSPHFAGPACQRRWQLQAAGHTIETDPAQVRAEMRAARYGATLNQMHATGIADVPSIAALLEQGYTPAPQIGMLAAVRYCHRCDHTAHPITEISDWPGGATPTEVGHPYYRQRCRGCLLNYRTPSMIGLLSFDAGKLTRMAYASAQWGYNNHETFSFEAGYEPPEEISHTGFMEIWRTLDSRMRDTYRAHMEGHYNLPQE